MEELTFQIFFLFHAFFLRIHFVNCCYCFALICSQIVLINIDQILVIYLDVQVVGFWSRMLLQDILYLEILWLIYRIDPRRGRLLENIRLIIEIRLQNWSILVFKRLLYSHLKIIIVRLITFILRITYRRTFISYLRLFCMQIYIFFVDRGDNFKVCTLVVAEKLLEVAITLVIVFISGEKAVEFTVSRRYLTLLEI